MNRQDSAAMEDNMMPHLLSDIRFPLPHGFSGLVDISHELPPALFFGIPNYPPRTANEISVYVAAFTVAWICLSAIVRVSVRSCLHSRQKAAQKDSAPAKKLRKPSSPASFATRSTPSKKLPAPEVSSSPMRDNKQSRKRRKGHMDLKLVLPSSSEENGQKTGTNASPSSASSSGSGPASFSTSSPSTSSSSSSSPSSPTEMLLDACARAAGLSRNTGVPRTLLDVSSSTPSLHALAGSILSPTSPFSSTIRSPHPSGDVLFPISPLDGLGGRSSATPTTKQSDPLTEETKKAASPLASSRGEEGEEVAIALCEEEMSSRIVSLCHGVLSTAYASYVLFGVRLPQFKGHGGGEGGGSWTSSATTASFVRNSVCLNEPPLVDEQLLTSFVASYFIYDTLGILFGSFFDVSFLLHHVGALVILLSSLLGQRMGQEMCVGILLLESTSPQLHIRWLMTTLGWSKQRCEEGDLRATRSPKLLGKSAGNNNKREEQVKKEKALLSSPSSYLAAKARQCLWWLCDTGFLISFGGVRLGMGLVAFALFSPSFCPTAPIASFVVLGLVFLFSALFFIKTCVKASRGEEWIA